MLLKYWLIMLNVDDKNVVSQTWFERSEITIFAALLFSAVF